MYAITVKGDTISDLINNINNIYVELTVSKSEQRKSELVKQYRANEETENEKAKANVTNIKPETSEKKSKSKPTPKEESKGDDNEIPDYAKVVRPATFKFVAAHGKGILDEVFAVFQVTNATELKPAQYQRYMTALANRDVELAKNKDVA